MWLCARVCIKVLCECKQRERKTNNNTKQTKQNKRARKEKQTQILIFPCTRSWLKRINRMQVMRRNFYWDRVSSPKVQTPFFLFRVCICHWNYQKIKTKPLAIFQSEKKKCWIFVLLVMHPTYEPMHLRWFICVRARSFGGSFCCSLDRSFIFTVTMNGRYACMMHLPFVFYLKFQPNT